MNLAGKISGLSGDADVLFGGESYNGIGESVFAY